MRFQRSTVWLEAEIDAWIDEVAAGHAREFGFTSAALRSTFFCGVCNSSLRKLYKEFLHRARLLPVDRDIRSLRDYGLGQMNLMRAFLLRHRAMAFFLVLAALCMKIVVPTGFMIGQNSKVLTVQLCTDGLGHAVTAKIAIPMNGEPSDSSGKQGKAECPFASLSMASMTGADTALLALALAFILALGFTPAPPPHPRRIFHLRPPLRGPPALV